MSDPVFDKSKPYGEVFGKPGVRYNQGGHRFNAQGEYVPPNHPDATAERMTGDAKKRAEEEARKALRQAFKERLAAGTAVTIKEAPVVAKKVLDPDTFEITPIVDDEGSVNRMPLEDAHWTVLKAMCEERGHDYPGKQKAIQLLRGE